MESEKTSAGLNLYFVALQYECFLGDPKRTYEEKVKKLLEAHAGKKIDVIVLPECSLTGYDFESKELVIPLAEECTKGDHFKWCQEIATTYNSHVVMGYIEKGVKEGEVGRHW